MAKRKKVIIIIVLIIVLLIIFGLLFWFLRLRQQPGGQAIIDPSKIYVPTTLPSASAGLPVNPEPVIEEKDLETTLKAVASTFTERFGSYSNEGNFSNLDELRDLMTIRMRSWTENYKISQKVLLRGDSFYGITTQALSVKIENFDESFGQANVLVKTQRQEMKGTTKNPLVFYQDLKMQLINSGDGWKVDEVKWQ